MNEKWITKNLHELLEVQNGYAFSSKNFNILKGIPLIRIRDLKNGYHTETQYIGEYDRKYLVKKDDLLIGMDGEFGCYKWLGDDALLNQRVCKLHSFSREIYPNFLLYGLNSYLKKIEERTGYTTVKHLSSRQIHGIQFSFPSFEEQKRIVSILDESFEAIDIAKANTERNLQNARALFESYLNDIFSQKGEGWHETTLGKIGVIQTGSTPKTSDKNNYGNYIPFIKPANFNKDGTLNYADYGLSMDGLALARLIKAGSVLMVCIGTIGKCGYCDRDVTTNQQINSFTPDDGIDYKFIYFQLLTRKFQHQVWLKSGQTTLPIINKSKWSNLRVSLPSQLHNQRQIVKNLEKMSQETLKLEAIYQKKLSALEEIKKSLLHQAFNGEL
ncbi:restriction endonuclease subunit S [Estrella lausannensis]|uniref:Type I restriction-modification system, S subunit n=1 Tax=Estrella lausannensis TaxID=483423 RepID=A0A0H5DTK3_9BACT|nr:restriction endonuclease subunit S [Estrella lausannensis]CRX39189.1 Type I restriction-modification system, S subunit [Estrella lausannensis]